MKRQKPQLEMILDITKLDDQISIPEGYQFVKLQNNIGDNWIRIINNTFGYTLQLENFEKEMHNISNGDSDQLLFIESLSGDVVGTGAVELKQSKTVANLHYIAVEKGHVGKGLGYLISKQLLINARKLGANFATLQMDDYRIPAIKTYLKLGFRPLLVHSNQAARWKDLVEKYVEWN